MRMLVRGLLFRGHGRQKRRRAAVCTQCCQKQLACQTKDDLISMENCLPVANRGSVDTISGVEEPMHDLKLKDHLISEGTSSPGPMMDSANGMSGVKKSLLEPERKDESFSDVSFPEERKSELGQNLEDAISGVESLEPRRELYGVQMKEEREYSRDLDYDGLCEAITVDAIAFLDDALGAGCGRKVFCPNIMMGSPLLYCMLTETERDCLKGRNEVKEVDQWSTRIVYDMV